LIRDGSSFGNPLYERFRRLALYLPCCLVVTDLEPSRKRPGQSDDHEDETNCQESNRPSFEVCDEDGQAAGA